jgi:PAS domain S-box-containing protein
MNKALRAYRYLAERLGGRRRAVEALIDSERKYRELLEHANSIILHWTRDGRITFLNEFGQRFFGYSEEEIVGRHVVGTIVPESESTGRDLRPLMDRICADPVAFEQNVNENMRRNGEKVWIAWTNKVYLDDQGRVEGILSIGTDVTERKRADEELRRLNADLERRVLERTADLAAAKERAESADRLKSAFLAAMSHEVRTPLNSIIGFTGIVLQGLPGPLNDEQKKQLGMVQGSARHLLALINDILDLSKIEAGQLEIEARPFDAREAVESVVRLIAPLAEKKGLALTREVAPEVGEVTGDRRRFEQILINLVNNALKFSGKGEVRIECGVDGRELVTRVVDTGIGIRPEDLGKLFQAFRQIDTGLSRSYEGTGLGLSICKKLVEMLGGGISVESEWGVGSTFTFRLPLGRG